MSRITIDTADDDAAERLQEMMVGLCKNISSIAGIPAFNVFDILEGEWDGHAPMRSGEALDIVADKLGVELSWDEFDREQH
ncbi:hypothetical protein [Bradyrhizobium elkanii]|uniref:hypothetical protein n=1 Tax=Bradyrhizobium elkanii TaxID=29448 RepID=UPI003D1E0D3F